MTAMPLEDMRKLISSKPTRYMVPPEVLERGTIAPVYEDLSRVLIATLKQGKVFNIAIRLDDNIADINFKKALDMYINMELQHPYGCYAISYVYHGCRFVDLVTHGADRAITIVSYCEPVPGVCDKVHMFSICTTNPVYNVNHEVMVDTTIHKAGTVYQLVAEHLNTTEGEEFENSIEKGVMKSVVEIFILLYMLHTRAVSLDKIMPDKDQRRHARLRGQPVPRPYSLVTYIQPEIPTRPEPQGGTHASPVMHERRGHYRNYKSGKRAWVRDCVVNAKMGDPNSPKRTHYEIAS